MKILHVDIFGHINCHNKHVDIFIFGYNLSSKPYSAGFLPRTERDRTLWQIFIAEEMLGARCCVDGGGSEWFYFFCIYVLNPKSNIYKNTQVPRGLGLLLILGAGGLVARNTFKDYQVILSW